MIVLIRQLKILSLTDRQKIQILFLHKMVNIKNCVEIKRRKGKEEILFLPEIINVENCIEIIFLLIMRSSSAFLLCNHLDIEVWHSDTFLPR